MFGIGSHDRPDFPMFHAKIHICFEVIDAVQDSMKHATIFGNRIFCFFLKFLCFFRAHLSGISDKEIKQAMKALNQPNLNESLSVDARQELDLGVGIAFTRFQTRYFQVSF